MPRLLRLLAGLPLFVSVPLAQAYTTLSGDLSGQTLAAGTYQVLGNLTVADGTTLTLAADAVLKFEPGTGLTVYGTLLSGGTAGNPVILTSRDDNTWGESLPTSDGQPEPGDWSGVHCYGYSSNDGIADLSWTTIAWGGGPGNPATANLYLQDSNWATLDHCSVLNSAVHGCYSYQVSPTLSGCQFDNNGSYGLYTSGGAPLLTDNSFTGNGSWAGYLDGASLLSLAGNTGTGNGINGLGLAGTLYNSSTWSQPDPAFPFVLAGAVNINDGITLTLPAGTLVKAADQIQLLCYGTLACQGTAQDPVRFVSLKDDSQGGDTNGDGPSSGSPGDWLGIQAYGYSTNDGILDFDYTMVQHGGGSGAGQGGIYLVSSNWAILEDCTISHCSASGILSADSSPEVRRCRLEYNNDHGLHAFGSSGVVLEDNQFNHNQDWGAYLANQSFTAYTGNTGTGNGVNGLGLAGTLYTSLSWSQPDPAFPFVLAGAVTINDGITLTLPAGTLVKAADQIQLLCYGTLACQGTALDPVRFVSLKDDSQGGDTNGDGPSSGAPGDWLGIQAYGYSSNDGILDFDYTVVQHGGGSGAGQGGIYLVSSNWAVLEDCTVSHCSASGILSADSSPVLRRCRLEYNNDHGLHAFGSSGVVLENNQFDHNQDWGAYLANQSFTAYTGNTGTGNGVNGLGLAGTLYTSLSWSQPDPAFPFVLAGAVTINDGITLTLPAGTLVKAADQIQLLCYGTLVCQGTALDPVRFVSLKDDSQGGDTNGDGPSSGAPGDWLGIQAYGYSSNDGRLDLHYTELHHGGGSGAGQGGLYLVYSDWAILEECTIGHCSASGLQISECSPVVTASAFVGNLHHGLYATGGSSPVLANNQFLGNQQWGAYLAGSYLTAFSGNGGSGNGINGLGLYGSITGTTSWSSTPGFPFVLDGEVVVNDNSTLNLGQGTVCKGRSTGRFVVYGTLNATGLPAAPVVLTSLADDSVDGDTGGDGISPVLPGGWMGILLYGYSSYEGIASLSWCQLDHAGNGQPALHAQYSDQLSISHSRILHSLGAGLQADYCSFSLDHSLVVLNQGDGVVHNGYTAGLGACGSGSGGNCFLFNQGYALNNLTANPIQACGNFWGSTDEATIDAMIHDDEESAGVGAVDFGDFSTTGCSPVISSITVADGLVTLEWIAVPGASGYRVESGAAAWSGFGTDLGGVFSGTQWTAPQPVANTHYRVIALYD